MNKPIRLSLIILVVFFSINSGSGQTEIPLVNPSFEGEPRRSVALSNGFFLVDGWIDWVLFPAQNGPDIHGIDIHGIASEFWNVLTVPYDGESFVGLVTREDETWECIGQKLPSPLRKLRSYDLVLYLCQDPHFASITKSSHVEPMLFNSPAVVRIWGSNGVGNLDELLTESHPIMHEEWRKYNLFLQPQDDYTYLVIEAFYPLDYHGPTNGHVLIDNAKLLQYK